jgi:tetratricopeptide (TPR) repeat protein
LAAAVGIPLLLLVGLEGTLRLAGYGYPTCFFLTRSMEGRTVWTDNQDFGRRFFPPGLVRRPQALNLPAEKPANTVRIFVLGESAAMGDPDFKFGLPRMLEVLLRERFPDKRFEVVNAAMVAINSHVILPIAQDCARKQGDLWVVYMGNNEMIGPYGAASVFGAKAPALPLVRAGLQVKCTRLGQSLDSALYRIRHGRQPLPEWGGMEMMASQRVSHDAPAATSVHQHFERNLRDILETGVRVGVPVVVCSVASNLENCAPFASLHRSGLSQEDLAKWQSAYDNGVTFHREGKLTEAWAAFETAANIDGEFAELSFRRALCARDLGKTGEAAVLFGIARDLDALQFRTDSRLNESIRRFVSAFANRGVRFLDSEALFATNSPQGLIGAEYFYEHVHLTPEGNYLLARAVAEQSAKSLGLESPSAWVSEAECFRLLGLTDWNRHDALNTIVDRLQMAPFTTQLNHAEQMRALKEQMARHLSATKPAQVARASQLVAQLVARHPEDPDLRWNLAQLLENAGDSKAALEQWRALVRLQPFSALPVFNLAQSLDRQGNAQEALERYEDSIRLDREYYPARYALGMLCLRSNRDRDAARHLNVAVQLKPQSLDARLAFAQALARTNRAREAEEQLREVLRVDPRNASAQAQLSALTGTN